MKRLVCVILTICMISCLGITVFSAEEVSVYVDGEKLTFDVPPVVEDGRTLVPIRAVSEYLKYNVNWNNDTQEVEIKNDDTTLVLGIGKITYTKNNEEKELDVPANLRNGRTMVPLRLVTENFGCDVQWDGNTSSVYITTIPNKTIEKTIDYTKWFPDSIPDFADYTYGSVINPLAVDYSFGTLYTARKSYEYLSYQPSGKETVKGITLNIGKTQSGMEKTFGDIVNKNTDSNKGWKMYPVEVKYIAGSGELNLNELLSANNIYNEFGEKYDIYDYYLIDCKLSPYGEIIGGKVLSEEEPKVLEVQKRSAGGVTSDYVDIVAICILSDKYPDAPLLRVYTNGGEGSIWMHIDSSKTIETLELKTKNVGKTIYDVKETDDIVTYAVKMRIKQLEIKIEATENKSQAVLNNKYYTTVNGEWILWYDEELVNELNSDLAVMRAELTQLKALIK